MQELLKKRLKEKGLKVTRQRLLVLSVLEQNNGSHMTAEDIYELVSEDYPEIGLATVYRTLQLLWDMQLVDRISFDDGCVRYELGHLLRGKQNTIIIILYAGDVERSPLLMRIFSMIWRIILRKRQALTSWIMN